LAKEQGADIAFIDRPIIWKENIDPALNSFGRGVRGLVVAQHATRLL